mgnify:FL=1|jgi:predicted thioesterase
MLEKGAAAQSRTTVCEANTAAAMGSGDMPVFATPAMVALMENAAMLAVAPGLPEGAATVGAEMNVSHIKPSGLGAEIVASAVVTAVEGRKITFNVGARDAEGMIGEGTHVRFIVDRERFLAKLK